MKWLTRLLGWLHPEPEAPPEPYSWVIAEDRDSIVRLGLRRMEIVERDYISTEVEAQRLADIVLADVLRYEGDDLRNSVVVRWLKPEFR